MSLLAASPAADLTSARADPGEVVIHLERLGKRFPSRRSWLQTFRHPFQRSTTVALQEVTCDIRRGEFFGLLGANGAGKTTLFKVLATLVIPDDGVATVEGLDVVRQADAVRRILAPVITDERSLHWRLSARENLALYARLQGLSGRQVQSRVNEVLHVVGLEPAHRTIVGALSSGMKQRLLIARALLAQPRVLLLDEPTRSLDPLSARSLRAFLRDELSARQGCTVLLATHNTEEALELCDRVAVLDRGHCLAIGTAEELGRGLAGGRYRAWVKGPWQPVASALLVAGAIREAPTHRPEADGWTQLELRIAGGPDVAADVLGALAREQVQVARYERVGVALADLIARVVERRHGSPDA